MVAVPLVGGEQAMALLPAHMGNIDHRQGIVRQDQKPGAGGEPRQMPPCHQGGERTFEAAQIQSLLRHRLVLHRIGTQPNLVTI